MEALHAAGRDRPRDPLNEMAEARVREELATIGIKTEWQWDEKKWAKFEADAQFWIGSKLFISCGAVVFQNIADADTRRVLVLKNKNSGIYSLPKGRTEPGESHQACACREVGEETGYVVDLLWKRSVTKCTLPVGYDGGELSEQQLLKLKQLLSVQDVPAPLSYKGVKGDPIRDTSVLNVMNQDVMACQAYDEPGTDDRKHVYWFLAKLKSEEPDERLRPQQDRNKFECHWLGPAQAFGKLQMGGEKMAVKLATELLQRMDGSETDWKDSERLSGREWNDILQEAVAP